MNQLGKLPGQRIRILMQLLGVFALAGLVLNGPLVRAEIAMSEYEVKALFLLNFAKYVDWPRYITEATNHPIVIGVYGENKIGNALQKAVSGKSIGGPRVTTKVIESEGELAQCQILYISASEKNHFNQIISKIKSLPVLTVGEEDAFTELGGVINFVQKQGRIRLEINLNAARQAKLGISSKLLSVADVVKGKEK